MTREQTVQNISVCLPAPSVFLSDSVTPPRIQQLFGPNQPTWNIAFKEIQRQETKEVLYILPQQFPISLL